MPVGAPLLTLLLFAGAIAMIVCGSLRLQNKDFPNLPEGGAIALVVIGALLLLVGWTPWAYW